MMVPTRQVTVPTSAGRSVRFAQGIATIHDTNDLPYLFARDDCKVMVTEYAMSWMPEVLSKTPKINADVHWPPDWSVGRTEQGRWEIITPDPPVPDPEPEVEQTSSPEEGEATLDAVLKGKPRWQKPPAS
jgi:hypothetical protein